MDDILATFASVLRDTDNAVARRVLMNAAAHYLEARAHDAEEDAANKKFNRYALLGCLAVFAVAVVGLWTALARF